MKISKEIEDKLLIFFHDTRHWKAPTDVKLNLISNHHRF